MWLLVAVGIGIVVGVVAGQLVTEEPLVGGVAGAVVAVPAYAFGLLCYRGVQDGYGWPLAVVGVGVVIGAGLWWWQRRDDPYGRGSWYLGGGTAAVGAVVAGSWAVDILLTRLDRSIRTSTKGAIGLGGAVLGLLVIAFFVWAAANHE